MLPWKIKSKTNKAKERNVSLTVVLMIILTFGRSPKIAGNCHIDVVGELISDEQCLNFFSVLQPLQLFSLHVIQTKEVKNVSELK